jgi:hypothetical protein
VGVPAKGVLVGTGVGGVGVGAVAVGVGVTGAAVGVGVIGVAPTPGVGVGVAGVPVTTGVGVAVTGFGSVGVGNGVEPMGVYDGVGVGENRPLPFGSVGVELQPESHAQRNPTASTPAATARRLRISGHPLSVFSTGSTRSCR